MQNSSGNYRSAQSFRGSREPSSSSIRKGEAWKIIFYLLGFSLLTSCSIFSKKSPQLPNEVLIPKLQTNMKKICLTSEGKGRLQLLSKKHVFSYESLNDSSSKKWSLGLNIPLHGEEVMHLTWKRPVKVRGAFYRRLKQNLSDSDNGKEYEKLLNQYILQFAMMIHLIEDLRSVAPQSKCQGEDQGSCILNDHEFGFEGLLGENFSLTSMKDPRFQLILEATAAQNEYFQRLKIYLKDKERIGPLATLLKMELSLHSCQ